MLQGDRKLLAVVDATMARAARGAGKRLACRPGCTECCTRPVSMKIDVAGLESPLVARAGEIGAQR